MCACVCSVVCVCVRACVVCVCVYSKDGHVCNLSLYFSPVYQQVVNHQL